MAHKPKLAQNYRRGDIAQRISSLVFQPLSKAGCDCALFPVETPRAGVDCSTVEHMPGGIDECEAVSTRRKGELD